MDTYLSTHYSKYGQMEESRHCTLNFWTTLSNNRIAIQLVVSVLADWKFVGNFRTFRKLIAAVSALVFAATVSLPLPGYSQAISDDSVKEEIVETVVIPCLQYWASLIEGRRVTPEEIAFEAKAHNVEIVQEIVKIIQSDLSSDESKQRRYAVYKEALSVCKTGDPNSVNKDTADVSTAAGLPQGRVEWKEEVVNWTCDNRERLMTVGSTGILTGVGQSLNHRFVSPIPPRVKVPGYIGSVMAIAIILYEVNERASDLCEQEIEFEE